MDGDRQWCSTPRRGEWSTVSKNWPRGFRNVKVMVTLAIAFCWWIWEDKSPGGVAWRNHCFCCLLPKLCRLLCGSIDCSPPGSSVHGIFQAFPSPGDLPDPGIEPLSPALEGRFFTAEERMRREKFGVKTTFCKSLLQKRGKKWGSHWQRMEVRRSFFCFLNFIMDNHSQLLK